MRYTFWFTRHLFYRSIRSVRSVLCLRLHQPSSVKVAKQKTMKIPCHHFISMKFRSVICERFIRSFSDHNSKLNGKIFPAVRNISLRNVSTATSTNEYQNLSHGTAQAYSQHVLTRKGACISWARSTEQSSAGGNRTALQHAHPPNHSSTSAKLPTKEPQKRFCRSLLWADQILNCRSLILQINPRTYGVGGCVWALSAVASDFEDLI